jgi:hypothetical protein
MSFVAKIRKVQRENGKLTMEKAREIRARAWTGNERNADIALDYGINASAVHKIKHGEIWRESSPWGI